MSESLQLNQELMCDGCGQYGAFDFGDRHLCLNCYEESGSCCPEFGKGNLAEIAAAACDVTDEQPPKQS